MNEKYIEAFKKNGFSYEEIQTIIESEKEFDKIWISYDFNKVKILARKELFSHYITLNFPSFSSKYLTKSNTI